MFIRTFRRVTKSKRTYERVLVLPSRRLVRPAVDDDFVIFLTKGYEKKTIMETILMV